MPGPTLLWHLVWQWNWRLGWGCCQLGSFHPGSRHWPHPAPRRREPMPKQLAGRQATWSSLPRACGSATRSRYWDHLRTDGCLLKGCSPSNLVAKWLSKGGRWVIFGDLTSAPSSVNFHSLYLGWWEQPWRQNAYVEMNDNAWWGKAPLAFKSRPRERRSLVPMAGKKEPRKVVITQGATDSQVMEGQFFKEPKDTVTKSCDFLVSLSYCGAQLSRGVAALVAVPIGFAMICWVV